MDKNNKTKILLISQDLLFVDLVCFSLESTFNFEIVVADTFDEAFEDLTKFDSISLIIGESDKENCLTFFRKKIDIGNFIPMVLIVSSEGMKNENYKGSSFAALILKNQAILPLNKFITDSFQIDETFDKDEYTSVSLSPLCRFEATAADLFIKLKTGRLVHLFQTGDTILKEDVERYQRKGVFELYIHKEAARWVLAKIDKNFETILSSGDAQIDLKDEPSENDHIVIEKNEMPDISNPFAMPEKMIEVVHEKMVKTIQKIKANKNLSQFLNSEKVDRDAANFFKVRTGLVSNITCNLANSLFWGSDATYEKLVYVAHMHDLTLYPNAELAKIFDKDDLELGDFSKQEKEKFLKHPDVVAALIEKDSKAPGDAALIITQHHEKSDRSGFPKGISSTKMAPLASLLVFSIALAQHIIENPQWTIQEYIEKYRSKFKGDTFNKIFLALEKQAIKR